MRRLPVVLAAALLAGPAAAQQREPSTEIHCELDQTKSDDSREFERKCLAQLPGLAARAGDVLRLTLADGRTKEFTDASQACERLGKCLLYRLSAYYPTRKLFVIEWLGYEKSNVLVVGRRTGTVTRMDVHPHLSPSGERMVAAAAIEAWDVEKHIAIYSVENDSLEWSYKAQDYELWEFVAWDGDDRIKLQVELWTVDRNGERTLAKQPAELRRTNSGWKLNKNTAS